MVVKYLALVVGGIVAAATLVGCGGFGAGSGNDEQARRQLSLLADIYGDFLNGHGGAAPKDDAEFRAILPSYERRVKATAGDVDALLTSPRDGQPFVIVVGKSIVPKDSPTTPWAAYESTGVDGKRLAAQVRGAVLELSPEEFAQQFPGR